MDSEDDTNATATKPSSTFEISEETKTFLEACFNLPRPVDNKTRKSWLMQFGLPKGNETMCPKLDTITKNELPRHALEVDRKLSRLQNFVLDAVGPLVSAYEDLILEDDPDPERILQSDSAESLHPG